MTPNSPTKKWPSDTEMIKRNYLKRLDNSFVAVEGGHDGSKHMSPPGFRGGSFNN